MAATAWCHYDYCNYSDYFTCFTLFVCFLLVCLFVFTCLFVCFCLLACLFFACLCVCLFVFCLFVCLFVSVCFIPVSIIVASVKSLKGFYFHFVVSFTSCFALCSVFAYFALVYITRLYNSELNANISWRESRQHLIEDVSFWTKVLEQPLQAIT